MPFLAPGNMAFLILAGVILLFYLLKRKYREELIPSTLLWTEMKRDWEASRPWQKLRRNLLLLLQLLFVLLLVLALMRPYVRESGIEAEHAVIVLDVSASMEAGNRLEKAKAGIRELIDRLQESQRITLVTMGSQPGVLASRSNDKGELRRLLDSVQIDFGNPDVSGTLSLAYALAAGQGSAGEVMIFSDQDLKDAVRNSRPGVPVRVVGLGGEPANLSIAQLGVKDGEAVVTVINHGRQAAEHVKIVLRHGEERIASQTVSLQPGERKSLFFSRLPDKDWYAAEVEIPENFRDDFARDNIAYGVPLSQGEKRILYLSGEPSPFVEKAFQTAGATVVKAVAGRDGAVPVPGQNGNEPFAFTVVEGLPEKDWPAGNLFVIAPPAKAEGIRLKYRLEVVNGNHPLLRHAPIEEIHVIRARTADAGKYGEVLARSGEVPLIVAGTWEGRRIAMLNFALQDSDLPLRVAFPVLLANAAEWLNNDGDSLGQFLAGEDVRLALSPYTEEAWVETPEGKRIELPDPQADAAFQVPGQPGIYFLHEKGSEGWERIRPFAVNMSLEQMKPGNGESFTLQQEGEGETAGDGEATVPKEIGQWLALAAFLILLLEWEAYRYGY